MPTYKVTPILVHNEFIVQAENAEEAADKVIWDELPQFEWRFEVKDEKDYWRDFVMDYLLNRPSFLYNGDADEYQTIIPMIFHHAEFFNELKDRINTCKNISEIEQAVDAALDDWKRLDRSIFFRCLLSDVTSAFQKSKTKAPPPADLLGFLEEKIKCLFDVDSMKAVAFTRQPVRQANDKTD